MRGILSSVLATGLVFLLAPAVSAQNVTVDLTPITYPIVLPDSGGSFDYLLTVTNQGGSAITATVWCMASLPGGSSWGPVVGPATQTLGAGQTQSFFRTQTVPPRAPFGYFWLHAYAGNYPDTVWAQDQFEFQHQAISGTEQEWVARYEGPGNIMDEAYAIAIDGDGNVFVTGVCDFSGVYPLSSDYATVKYDASGNLIWIAIYNGPGNGIDYARSLAVDADGNSYVTGKSLGSGTNYDYATVKYDGFGNQMLVSRYNGSANSWDEAYSLTVDGSGNFFVTGTSLGSGTNYDFATVKYDTSGHQIWAARYDGPVNGLDEAHALAVDGDGNVYVTGYSDSDPGMSLNYDYATIKYDASGNQLWIARYNGLGNGNDLARSLAVDSSGNVYVTGGSVGFGGNGLDYATIKYDAMGNQLWATRYNGPGNGPDGAYSLALDGANVYVTGESDGNGSYYDCATVKYDLSGNQIWVARYNRPGNAADHAYSLAVDGNANVYVTGASSGSGSDYDYVTLKYDAIGNQIWVALYNGPGNDWDQANSLAVDDDGNVYVTGRSRGRLYGAVDDYDYCTIKYSGGNIANWMPVEATVFGQPLPQECRLEGNFPNPFNATTAISYKLQASSHVNLRVYDTAGRLVTTLVDGWRSAGEHELTWQARDLPSGMYFAKLEAGGYVGVQKMVLLK